VTSLYARGLVSSSRTISPDAMTIWAVHYCAASCKRAAGQPLRTWHTQYNKRRNKKSSHACASVQPLALSSCSGWEINVGRHNAPCWGVFISFILSPLSVGAVGWKHKRQLRPATVLLTVWMFGERRQKASRRALDSSGYKCDRFIIHQKRHLGCL
jgi:hypothetical protein